MTRLDHPIPSIRLRQLEKLHRLIVILERKDIDMQYIKQQFAIQHKSLSQHELQLYGEIFEKQSSNLKFTDIQEPLDYLLTKTNINIPHQLDDQAPLIFYTTPTPLDNADDINNNPIDYPTDLNDADAVFTFACDTFPSPSFKPTIQSNQFLLQLFNYDYHPLILHYYLLYHPLNLQILKAYVTHIQSPSDCYYLYTYLSTINTNPSTYHKALNIIFPLLKVIQTTLTSSIITCISNTCISYTPSFLQQHIHQPLLLQNTTTLAILHKEYQLLYHCIKLAPNNSHLI